jgi:hypothetical protein
MLKYIAILSFGATICGAMPAGWAQIIQTGVVIQNPVQVNTAVLSSGFNQGGEQVTSGIVVQNSRGSASRLNVQTGVVVQNPVQVNTAVLSTSGRQGGGQFTSGAVIQSSGGGRFRAR